MEPVLPFNDDGTRWIARISKYDWIYAIQNESFTFDPSLNKDLPSLTDRFLIDKEIDPFESMGNSDKPN